MYALFSSSEDYILMNETTKCSQTGGAGIIFRGLTWHNEEIAILYEIIDEKKFIFTCLKLSIMPEIQADNPLLNALNKAV